MSEYTDPRLALVDVAGRLQVAKKLGWLYGTLTSKMLGYVPWGTDEVELVIETARRIRLDRGDETPEE